MITFQDGMEITWEEIAGLIEAEGCVGRGLFLDLDGLRCSAGVIEGWSQNDFGHFSRKRSMQGLLWTNDIFKGTPEERCAHMVAWARPQEVSV